MHFLALVAETFCVVLIRVDGLKFCSVRISFVDLECFPVWGLGGLTYGRVLTILPSELGR
jgi:hypothetical protein